jgi:hypothetical protein
MDDQIFERRPRFYWAWKMPGTEKFHTRLYYGFAWGGFQIGYWK